MKDRFKFSRRLRVLLKNFDYNAAVKLSLEMHEAEANGYEISNVEDKLWERLTARIMEYKID